MKILNTLSGQKEEFVPLKDKKVNMFVCGPTVYNYIHIGNARTFVFFDVVAKYLKHKGYGIDYVQNITDIDDKIINKAKSEDKTWKEVADLYFEEFKKDTLALGIDSPRYLRATDYIDAVKEQVKRLKEKGHVYLIESDGWYFDLKTFPEYGKLSKRTAEMADDAVSRIDESDKKRNTGDFCVWKLADKSESGYWDDDELGYGRPGWHIEDTAITEGEFGSQYDIHGGAQDLIFPHHEAEIAQQESASGKTPFVKYWIHAGFLVNKEQKMSKSLGNFMTLREALEKWPKEALRFYLLSNHYRSPLDYSEGIMKQSQAAVQRISEFKEKLDLSNGKEDMETDDTEQKFLEAMDDDFNTARAVAAIFDLMRSVNPMLADNSLNHSAAKKVKKILKDIDSVLGIVPVKKEKIPDDVMGVVQKREELRQAKDWNGADKLRAQIEEMGYKVEDTIYGPLVTPVRQ